MRLKSSALLFSALPACLALASSSQQLLLSQPLIGTESVTLVDLLSRDEDYTLLIHLLQRSRLITTLNRLKSTTFFAPNNDAVRKARSNDILIDAALSSDDLVVDNIQAPLRSRLLYHMLNGTLAYNVSDAPTSKPETLETLLLPHPEQGTGKPGTPPDEETGHGLLGDWQTQRIRLRRRESSTFVGVGSDGSGGVKIIGSDLRAGNSTLVTVDSMLETPKNLTHIILNHPSLTRLANLLTPQLKANLSTSPHLTIFAPRDEAWDSLDDLQWSFLNSRFSGPEMEEVMGFHSVDGPVGYSDRLVNESRIVTRSGEIVNVAGSNEASIRINDTSLTQWDILASNGVLHIVDNLLLPTGKLQLTPEKYLLALNATKFVALLRESNVSRYIQTDSEDQASYTILAPRDDVFENWSWLTKTAGGLPAKGSRELRDLLEYHILEGKIMPEGLVDGQYVDTVSRPVTLAGLPQKLIVSLSGGDEMKSGNGDIAFGNANVIAEPVEVGNSIIYLLSQVLEAPTDVLETAVSDLRLSDFVTSVYAANLDSVAKTRARTTYLVPTNEAFESLGLAMKYLLQPSSRSELKALLSYHVVDDVLYFCNGSDYGTGRPWSTVEGSQIYIDDLRNGSFQVRGPEIKGLPVNGEQRSARAVEGALAHLLTSTGSLHIIDQVELPPTLDITIDKLMRGGKANTMRDLIHAANYTWIIEGKEAPETFVSRHRKRNETEREGSGEAILKPYFTVLCPTDKAFTKVNLTYYLNEPEALKTLVELHIIPFEAPELTNPTEFPDGPIILQDGTSYPTLLSGHHPYGDLTFKALPGDNWIVGIRGAQRRGGKGDQAPISNFGKATPKIIRAGPRPEIIFGGGVVQIDSVLMPFNPTWWELHQRTFLVTCVTIFSVSCFVGLSLAAWRAWRLLHPKEGYQALEGEEN